MVSYRIAFSVLFCTALLVSFTIPLTTDTFLDIDGISIAPGTDHVCVIEVHAESPIGGRVRCWGKDEHGKLKPPKNV